MPSEPLHIRAMCAVHAGLPECGEEMSDPRAWNPWHGCRKYSEGCANCYMYYLDEARGVPEKSSEIAKTGDFYKPLMKDGSGRYRVPAGFMLRVNMTSDTFLEEAGEWLGEMWRIIRRRPDVIFYVLTKRAYRIPHCLPEDWGGGYENVSLNITCESQSAFDERWPVLEKVPAKHKGLSLSPLLTDIDITPALESGQIELVSLGGEGYGGTTPCRYEWMEKISRDCGEYGVNFVAESVGSVFVKNGSVFESDSPAVQARWAFNTGLTHISGKPEYRLYSPYDGHLLGEDELIAPVFNKNRCFRCSWLHLCSGCIGCGGCKDVALADIDGNEVAGRKQSVNRILRSRNIEDYFRNQRCSGGGSRTSRSGSRYQASSFPEKRFLAKFAQ